MSLIRYHRAWATLACWGAMLSPRPACAEAASTAKQVQMAEEAFDLGVKHFESHNYAASARAFLRADALRPDTDTLANALTAAKKSRDHLLTVEVARRALVRTEDSPGLESAAREALAVSGPHLAQLELRCKGQCSLRIDGEETNGENVWLNPGTHRLSAHFSPSGATNTKTVVLAEGANYAFNLEEPESAEEEGSAPAAGTPVQSVAPQAQPSSSATEQTTRAGSVGWTDEVIFMVGVGATLGLTGATVWSGLDAKNAQSKLSATPGTEELDPVYDKVKRTDVLLGATIGTAALSIIWAVWGVDFKTKPDAVTGVVSSEYVGVVYGGCF